MDTQLEMFDYWGPQKEPQTVADMVEEFATTAEQPKDVPMSARLIYEEFQEWADEYEDSAGKPEAELKELGDNVYVIFGYARARGWDLLGAVKAIHENNMGRMVQDDGTILRREDGKIIKNPNYPKVDMTPFLGENK